MTRSGFGQHPSPGSHVYCHEKQLSCDCVCHTDIAAFDDGVKIGEAPLTTPYDPAADDD